LLRRVISKSRVWRFLLVCVALALFGSVRLQSKSHLVPKQEPQPSSSAAAPLFTCTQLSALKNHKDRVAVLHGPDWVLESSVRPSCLPEKDVVFVAVVGRQIIPHPFTARVRLWVTKDHDVRHVRIVESSASSREEEVVAIGFVTNHKCADKNSRNCRVMGGAAFGRLD
jgi:hypothetical protein